LCNGYSVNTVLISVGVMQDCKQPHTKINLILEMTSSTISFWYVRNHFAMTAVDVSSENNSLYKSLVKSRNKQNSRLSVCDRKKTKRKTV